MSTPPGGEDQTQVYGLHTQALLTQLDACSGEIVWSDAFFGQPE